MDIFGMIKNLIGLNDNESSSNNNEKQGVVGGVDLDAMDRQQEAREVATIIDGLNIEDFNIHIKGKFWDEARSTLDEVTITNFEEALEDLNELSAEDFEACDGDMSLVHAGKKYIKDMLPLLKTLHNMVNAGEAGNDEEFKKIQDEFNAKNEEITNTWNNSLESFVAKHDIPWDAQF